MSLVQSGGEKACLELYSWGGGGGGGGGVEVLTINVLLFVCRIWNKQLVVTPKPGVS